MPDSQQPNPFERPQAKITSLRPNDRLALFSWALYDWANSAFSTISITLVAIYLKLTVFNAEQYGTWSGKIYAFTIGTSTVCAAIVAPIVGAMADAQATKHKWLSVTALLGALCGFLVGFIPPEHSYWIALLFGLTVLFFELSYGVYNAFLPELADESTMNRVSALGFGLGYIGGALALILALLVLTFGDGFELTKQMQIRTGIMIMGAWWGIFTLPAIFYLRDKNPPRNPEMRATAVVKSAVEEVITTLKEIRHYRMLAIFLIGYLFFNDCVQTVITMAPTMAEHDLKFDSAKLVYLVLVIQFIALPGSILMGRLSDRWGQRPVLFLCLTSWGLILLSAWFVTTQFQFWILGGFVALVMGGIQSVSRAIMGYMTPPDRSAQFFGFFNLTSKATSFIGPYTFVLVYDQTQSYRLAIVSLIGQLIIGFWLVSRVDIEKGRQQALENTT